MDSRVWVYLDNLRCGHPPSTNLATEQAEFAAVAARASGFVSDEPKKNRLTRKGKIALLLSLGKEQEKQEGVAVDE